MGYFSWSPVQVRLMTEDRLVALITRQWSGALTPAEVQELEQWAEEAPQNRRLLNKMSNEEALLEKELRLWKQIDPAQAFANWISLRQTRRRARLLRISGWSAAAACMLATVAVIGLKRGTIQKDSPAPVLITKTPTILPGRNTATLTLANGKRILLDSAGTGVLARQGNAKLVKVDNGTIAYWVTGAKEEGAVTYNTLATPRAAQFKLQLPDGTQVWLNNASSIRYPSSFFGSTRTVELTGQAYFDVAKDAGHPFLVKAGALSVDVLGTGFDLSAYSDEPEVLTTLVQGKIQVEKNGQRAILEPGQQVAATGDGGWKVKPVNTEAVTAWRDGLFNFDNADLHTVLRQLARWYDVDVEFRGAVPEKRLQGQMQRSLTLNQVLEILKDKDVQFVLQGRKLIVSP